MTIVRRFWDSSSNACSYLIGSDKTRQAVFIDPVFDQIPLYVGVLDELGYTLSCILETHLHADHVTAAASLRRLTGADIACGQTTGVDKADILLRDGQSLQYGELVFLAMATPGHSSGCITYRWNDRLFTGDALLIGGCGRTDEPGGNPGQLFDSISRRLLTLPDEILVYPGHGTQRRWLSCIGEERRNNPMLQGNSRDEFIALCHRRQEPPLPAMANTLAANRRCGAIPDPDGRGNNDFHH